MAAVAKSAAPALGGFVSASGRALPPPAAKTQADIDAEDKLSSALRVHHAAAQKADAASDHAEVFKQYGLAMALLRDQKSNATVLLRELHRRAAENCIDMGDICRAREPARLSQHAMTQSWLALHDPLAKGSDVLTHLRRVSTPLPLPGDLTCPMDAATLHVAVLSSSYKDNHPVGAFAPPLLRELHKTFRLSLYTGSSEHAAFPGGCVNVVDPTDLKALALRLRRDNVHVAIDLDGHTKGSLVDVFRYTPLAPVQITYLGYPASTGLSNVYRIASRYTDPATAAHDACYSETLVRLPGTFLCWQPSICQVMSRAIDNTPPFASQADNHVTFGAFSYPRKINDEVLQAWNDILKQVPRSRLMFKALPWRNPANVGLMKERLRAAKIDLQRVDFGYSSGFSSRLDDLRAVDISLDTWPYAHTTVACELLYMGVPIVTLPGDTHASRVTAGLLMELGNCEDLIAGPSVAHYVAAAVALANNARRLTELHATLRARFLASSICEPVPFGKKFRDAILNLWNIEKEKILSEVALTQPLSPVEGRADSDQQNKRLKVENVARTA